MAVGDPIQISQSHHAELQHLADLLHLFHHRNKNQHRRSMWWRHLSVFRKQLGALMTDLGRLNEAATTHLARTKKKARDAQINLTTAKRITFWRDVMVAKWQHAFSQLVADGRFSVLGLVLLAALSHVCQIVGITADLEELGQAEVERVLEEFGKEDWENEGHGHQHADEEDLGEVIQRDGDAAPVKNASTTLPPMAFGQQLVHSIPKEAKSTKKRSVSTSDRSSKKKRKKGNAIDDIFG